MADSIDRVFVKAIATIKTLSSKSGKGALPSPPLDTRTMLYGLYKQATEGNVDEIMPRPVGNTAEDVDAQLKWDAWKDQEGLSRTEAKRGYISCLIQAMKMYAGGSHETEELLSELEYMWEQVKDVEIESSSSASTDPGSGLLPGSTTGTGLHRLSRHSGGRHSGMSDLFSSGGPRGIPMSRAYSGSADVTRDEIRHLREDIGYSIEQLTTELESVRRKIDAVVQSNDLVVPGNGRMRPGAGGNYAYAALRSLSGAGMPENGTGRNPRQPKKRQEAYIVVIVRYLQQFLAAFAKHVAFDVLFLFGILVLYRWRRRQVLARLESSGQLSALVDNLTPGAFRTGAERDVVLDRLFAYASNSVLDRFFYMSDVLAKWILGYYS